MVADDLENAEQVLLANGVTSIVTSRQTLASLLSAANWTREKKRGLKVADVKAHLAGEVFVAPFHPRGPWPFVVIDVDRHNALQEKYFEETRRNVREFFPHAFEVTSSASQEVVEWVWCGCCSVLGCAWCWVLLEWVIGEGTLLFEFTRFAFAPLNHETL